MRKTLIALAAAGTLLLGACGDGGDDDEEAGDGSSTTMPEQSGEHAEFCTALLETMSGSATGETQSPGLPDVDAPPEIAEDWQLMQDAAERMSGLDSSAADFQQQQEQIQNELGGAERFNQAQQNVTAFLTENCALPGEEEMTSSTEGG